jgi:hypothetical protein
MMEILTFPDSLLKGFVEEVNRDIGESEQSRRRIAKMEIERQC